MDNLGEVAALIAKRAMELSKIAKNSQTLTEKGLYKCQACRDTGVIMTPREGEQPVMRNCECQEIKKAIEYLEASGLSPDQRRLTFANYKPYDTKTREAYSICAEYVKNFDELYGTNRNGVALLGQFGAGKSHLCIAIATNLINRKPNPVPVVYMSYVEVIPRLKMLANQEEEYNKFADRFKKAKLLVIDDLYKEFLRNGDVVGDLKETDTRHLYPILNYRYMNNLPMVISSEGTPDMLRSLDGALADRMLQNCKGSTIVFDQAKYNYRRR